jgi:hypothetical protein
MLEITDELEITPKVPRALCASQPLVPAALFAWTLSGGRLQIIRAKGRPETMSPEVVMHTGLEAPSSWRAEQFRPPTPPRGRRPEM